MQPFKRQILKSNQKNLTNKEKNITQSGVIWVDYFL